jgi:hypothetical protein
VLWLGHILLVHQPANKLFVALDDNLLFAVFNVFEVLIGSYEILGCFGPVKENRLNCFDLVLDLYGLFREHEISDCPVVHVDALLAELYESVIKVFGLNQEHVKSDLVGAFGADFLNAFLIHADFFRDFGLLKFVLVLQLGFDLFHFLQ